MRKLTQNERKTMPGNETLKKSSEICITKTKRNIYLIDANVDISTVNLSLLDKTIGKITHT